MKVNFGKTASNSRFDRTRIPTFRVPSVTGAPLNRGVRRQNTDERETTHQATLRNMLRGVIASRATCSLLSFLLIHMMFLPNDYSFWLNDDAASQGYFRRAIAC